MAKIIKMQNIFDRMASTSIGFDPYMEMYDELIGIVQSAKDMFLEMRAAFYAAADEIEIDPEEFELNQDIVDETYARTLDWMMPLENVPAGDPLYRLVWEAHKGGYEYDIEARKDGAFADQNIPIDIQISREKKGSPIEYYVYEEKRWEVDNSEE